MQATTRLRGKAYGTGAINDEFDRHSPRKGWVRSESLLVTLAETTKVSPDNPLDDFRGEASANFGGSHANLGPLGDVISSEGPASTTEALADARCRAVTSPAIQSPKGVQPDAGTGPASALPNARQGETALPPGISKALAGEQSAGVHGVTAEGFVASERGRRGIGAEKPGLGQDSQHAELPCQR
jgi:hypothetical protein